jgi:NAD(P)-dependent dehydrogenase (short-subunit alcohol dehydrogenase family)
VGQPRDIAELVLFLADPAKSGFITGQHFVADGGVTKRMTYPE